MTDLPPFSGWCFHYWMSSTSADVVARCDGALRAAFPGAEVCVASDPEADAPCIRPPGCAPIEAKKAAVAAACRAIKRAQRSGLK